VQVWRILRRRYLRDALSGRGGLVVSGRWHSRGRLIVYTSESLALSALEVLVHSESDLAPPDLMSVAIDIPDDVPVSRMNSRRLPQRWRRHPAPGSLQRLGDRWLAAQRTAVMQVPSAVIPSEHNYLINPTHPASRRVRIISVSRFSFDARLIQ
jgi:RES domain-containing protein